jgi:hypothetical protein
MSQNIQTFTEGAVAGTLNEARFHIQNAHQIIFLGFGFDPMNVQAIFGGPLHENQTVVGTSLGVGRVEIQISAPRLH